jgi:hypothetical protein
MLSFRRRLFSADVGVKSTEQGDSENIGIAVETAALSGLEREIRLFPVCQPPSCFWCQLMSFYVSRDRRICLSITLGQATSEMHVYPELFRPIPRLGLKYLIFRIQTAIFVLPVIGENPQLRHFVDQ